ncbi:MAG: LysR family transcriptional regulator substrate-binding protein [Oscillospiraceae bacterium]
MRIYPLTKERLCIVANKDNSLSKKKIINLNDIEKNDLILLNGQQQSNETLKKFLVDNMVDVNIAYEVPSFLSALELCRENLGIVITLEKIMKNITYPDVVTIPIEEKVFVWELYYIFKKDTSKQMETMHFYKYLLDYLDDYKK